MSGHGFDVRRFADERERYQLELARAGYGYAPSWRVGIKVESERRKAKKAGKA